MHPIDSPNATAGNEFTDGEPTTGTDATEIWSKWLNTMQRELIAVLTAAGITPDDEDDDQVIEAIQALIATEASARKEGDSTLQDNIDDEETARGEGDSTLQDNIDNEETARVAGDAALQALISAVQTPTVVTNTNGNPNISDTNLNIRATVAQNTWRSIGPTGGGATHTWSALDGLSSSVTYIRVRFRIRGTASSAVYFELKIHARRNGSAEAMNVDKNLVAERYAGSNYSGDADGIIIEATLPVSSRKFDLYWYADSGNQVEFLDMRLIAAA